VVCAGARAGDEKGRQDQPRTYNLSFELDHLINFASMLSFGGM
jgi:hypothetical protein